jgi:iron uptake system component EfeO
MRRATIRRRATAIAVQRRLLLPLPMLLATAALVSACGSSSSSGTASSGNAGSASSTVNIALTPAGCVPRPAKVPAGQLTVNVSNKDAGAVSEAELRTSDLSHILGEQENLTPGLSGGFSLEIQPGHYVINCPGASQMHWSFTVSGKATGANWNKNPVLVNGVSQYSKYVDLNVAKLVSSSQTMCRAIGTGNLTAAELAYPKSRVYYERIEPVAEIWGALDTDIDGRWDNPVTVASQFIGFHRIEQLMWDSDTLAGTAQLCAGLVHHEQQLLSLVRAATYNPLEMASGAADLINEAGTAKVTGEEERYSNTDLVVLQANVVGAQEVVNLLRPYLKTHDQKLLAQIDATDAAAEREVSRFTATPGYDDTGYVEYSTVLNGDREKLSQVLGAYEKSLDKLSLVVST